MNRIQRKLHKEAKFFREKVLPWYRGNKRVLPWRKQSISAYEVWVSEIMLQQTQVSRVISFYEKFLKRFPNVESLARASWKQFLPYYEGLGFYARGRNMLATAKIISEKYDGEFPRDKKLLQKLPGIGEYTASAILSFAYGKREVAFDTNFKKIFETRERAEEALRESGVSSAVFNSAVMDYSSAQKAGGRVKLEKRREGGKKKRQNEKQAVSKNMHHRALHISGVLVYVVLHEKHKKYFSSRKGKYEPFLMPEGMNSREKIKNYFKQTYGLTISVRPFEKADGIWKANAQILLGDPRQFQTFSRQEVAEKIILRRST